MNKKTCQSKLVGILKKAGTLYLMLSMILSLSLAISPVEASAAAKWPTRSDAKAFMDHNMGTRLSSSSGNQCVEVYNQYVINVCGQTPVSCYHAYEIYDKKQPQGWEKIGPNDINKHGGYKVGDIVVYKPNSLGVGSDGHVAIVYSVKNGNVTVFEQHYDGKNVTHTRPLYGRYDGKVGRTVKGIIRPIREFYVEYNANGGKGSMAKSTITYGVGAKLRKNTFTRSGYKFAGWNLYNVRTKKWVTSNGSKSVYKDQAVVKWTTDKDNDTIRAYAIWKKKSGSQSGPTGKIKSTSVSINTRSITLLAGNTQTLSASVNPSNATNKSIKWSTSNSSVATVNSNGKVTAVAPGTATITATAGDGNSKTTCSVSVILANGVYRLKHVGTGKMMNYAWGWKEFAYKPIFLCARDGSVEQTFRFRHLGYGKYEIDIMHREGGVMNVWTSKTVALGQKIGSWSKTNDDTQRFYVTPVGNGKFILRSAQNGNLAVAPDGSSRGYLKLVNYNTNDKNQQWYFEKVN